MEIALPGYDLDGNDLSIWLMSLPQHGAMYELAPTYAQYGYEPKQGNRIEFASRSQPYRLQDARARLLYVPSPDQTQPTEGPWGVFKYVAHDGFEFGDAASVWLHAPHKRVAASDFDAGSDNWTVINNGKAAALQPYGGLKYQRLTWRDLMWYIVAAEDEVHSDPNTLDDHEKWAFVAPTKFSGQHTIAYGGHLRFNIAAFAGDFNELNSNVVAVRLFCANCTFNTGESFVVLQESVHFDFRGGAAYIDIPLHESAWLRDPKSSIEEYEHITQCEMIEALAHMSGLQITADFTQKYESIGLDNVEMIAGPSKCCSLNSCQKSHPTVPFVYRGASWMCRRVPRSRILSSLLTRDQDFPAGEAL